MDIKPPQQRRRTYQTVGDVQRLLAGPLAIGMDGVHRQLASPRIGE